MTTSPKQAKANQLNAQKSTGPITIAGKLTISTNAVKHGIFSQHLLLADEALQDYEALHDGLVESLNPVGTLESALVERITVTLWRQQRLTRAESAITELELGTDEITKEVGSRIGRSAFSGNPLQPDELESIPDHLATIYQTIVDEYCQIDDHQITWDNFNDHTPAIFMQFETEAEEMRIEPHQLQEEYSSAAEYALLLFRHCSSQLSQHRERPKLQEIAQQVRDYRAIPHYVERDRLAKYQTMLDNELHKNLRALREAQQWRLHPLNQKPENGFVLEDEAA